MADRRRVAILVSGRGSNMAALLYASRADDCGYEVALVSGNKPEAPGLALAEAEGAPVRRLDGRSKDFWAELQGALEESRAEIIALAGFMKILPPEFVARWQGRIVNIHPSLLPKYPGLGTHEAALAAGDRVTGATVHVVTDDLDSGPILGQVEVAIMPGDTAGTLAERLLVAEHQLYPRVLDSFARRDRSPDWLLANVRELAMALPEVEERASHGSPAFFVKGGKVFAYFSANHHGDGRTAILVKISGADEQAMLIEQDEDRYYRPAYFGDSWIGVRLDISGTEWTHVEEWLTRSWRSAAPKRLAVLPF
jgi:formyltetrahydrofolate-dependent phosphoribosylglycinamide formyltransferase